jgi:hypothetical protein
VPEPSQTTFTPSVDLVSGASYVWRAQASDPAKGATSGFSAALSFTTINPDDGSFPYTLLVHLPGVCVFGQPFPAADYGFDNILVVSGDHLKFIVSNGSSFPGHPLDLEMARAGNHVAGTIGGGAGWGGPFNDDFLFSAGGTVAGSADNNGRLTGTLDGVVTIDTAGLREYVCTAPGLTWTLTPHR